LKDMIISNYAGLVKQQKDFYLSGRTRDVKFRKKMLITLKSKLIENQEAIFSALKQDLGKPEMEVLTSELGYVIQDIGYMLKNIAKWSKPKKVKTPAICAPGKSLISREPYGSVLVIGPWNYPLQLALLPAIGALAAGNTCVLKPSELTPAISEVMADIINNTFPEEYFKVVTGGPETAAELTSMKFNYLFFTGSTKVGKLVRANASANLVPMTLELGGKNPCIVHADADISSSARKIVWGKFYNAGQTCIAPDTVLVHDSVKNLFIRESINWIKIFYGDIPQKSTAYGRIVSNSHLDLLLSIIKAGTVLHGGQYDSNEKFLAPTLIDNIPESSEAFREEIFGPVMPIVSYRDTTDLFEVLQNWPTPLATYVFTSDKPLLAELKKSYPCGSLVINECFGQIMNYHLPFGGIGTSGLGSYHGGQTFQTFTRPFSIFKKPRKLESSFRYPPYNEKATELMKKMMLR